MISLDSVGYKIFLLLCLRHLCPCGELNMTLISFQTFLATGDDLLLCVGKTAADMVSEVLTFLSRVAKWRSSNNKKKNYKRVSAQQRTEKTMEMIEVQIDTQQISVCELEEESLMVEAKGIGSHNIKDHDHRRKEKQIEVGLSCFTPSVKCYQWIDDR